MDKGWKRWWNQDWSWDGLGKKQWIGQHINGAVSIQDYWRKVSKCGATDAEMEAGGELLHAPDGRLWHIAFVPIHWDLEATMPTPKANPADAIHDRLKDLIHACFSEAEATAFRGRPDPLGKEGRAIMYGVVWPKPEIPPEYRGIDIETYDEAGEMAVDKTKSKKALHVQCSHAWLGPLDARNARFGPGSQFFNTTFDGESDFTAATFEGRADFNEALFARTTYFNYARFSSQVRFDGSRFHEGAEFHGARFSGAVHLLGARFGGVTIFEDAQFTGNAHFYKVRFNGAVQFRGASFAVRALFSEATFAAGARFENVSFASEVRFNELQFLAGATYKGATFQGPAEFTGSVFTLDASFQHARFFDRADFGSANFRNTVMFNGARFGQTSLFQAATFSSRCRFEGARFVGAASFRGASLPDNEVEWREAFAGATFEDRLDWTGVDLDTTAAFSGVTLEQGILLSRVGEPAEQAANMKALKQALAAKEREEALRALEGGAMKMRVAMEGDRDRLREQRFYRLELRSRRRLKCALKQERAVSWLYDKVSGYGSSLVRPLVWLSVGVVMFAATFFLAAFVIDPNLVRSDVIECIWQALDFSWSNVFRPFSALNAAQNVQSSNEVVAALFQARQGPGSAVGFLVRIVSTLESLLALVLIFLATLAVKRRFQIR